MAGDGADRPRDAIVAVRIVADHKFHVRRGLRGVRSLARWLSTGVLSASDALGHSPTASSLSSIVTAISAAMADVAFHKPQLRHALRLLPVPDARRLVQAAFTMLQAVDDDPLVAATTINPSSMTTPLSRLVTATTIIAAAFTQREALQWQDDLTTTKDRQCFTIFLRRVRSLARPAECCRARIAFVLDSGLAANDDDAPSGPPLGDNNGAGALLDGDGSSMATTLPHTNGKKKKHLLPVDPIFDLPAVEVRFPAGNHLTSTLHALIGSLPHKLASPVGGSAGFFTLPSLAAKASASRAKRGGAPPGSPVPNRVLSSQPPSSQSDAATVLATKAGWFDLPHHTDDVTDSAWSMLEARTFGLV